MDNELEQRIAEMSDDEFDKLVARTRPPRVADDLGSRITAAEKDGKWRESFALKSEFLNELMTPKEN